MQINGNDADNNYRRIGLKIGLFYAEQIRTLATGTTYIDGNRYSVSRASYNNIVISMSKWSDSIADYTNGLIRLGLENSGVSSSSSAQAVFSSGDGSLKLSTTNASLSPQYLYMSRSGNAYTAGYESNGGTQIGYTVSGGEQNFIAPMVALTSSTGEDGYYGLFLITINENNVEARVVYTPSVSTSTYIKLSPSPGGKGYRPAGLVNNRDYVGGDPPSGSTVIYNTDILTQPGAPDESKASVVGSGFLTVYDITSANLTNLGKCLFSTNILNAIANIVINPLDFIVSLNIFPVTPHIGSSVPIKLGWFDCTENSAGFNANGAPLTSQFRVVDFGTLSVDEMWQSFLDYEATSFELFLPFIGTVSLSINEIMGGTINVQYTIDFYTGLCVANVLCTRHVDCGTDGSVFTQYSQHSYQGNCAIQVPVTQIGYSNLIGSIINAGISGIREGSGTGALQVATDAINAVRPDVTSKGSIVGNAGYCSTLFPYITIERPITAEPESYQTVLGYPSYLNSTLGECQDLCVCESIDLTGVVGATESEMQRIRQLCSEGVYV